MSEMALSEYQIARNDQLIRNEARKILTKISDARGARADASLRWPFELLQNALDVGARASHRHVEVMLEQDGRRILFEHDGGFFSVQELAALNSGGSSKEFESEYTTGRFGTGFLVTHVLAPSTRVSGIVATASGLERFELLLNRDGDEESIVRNIEDCYTAIRDARSIESAEGLASARFEYVVDDDVTLQRGIDAFHAAVPYLFATNHELGRVTFRLPTGVVEWEGEEPSSRSAGTALVTERVVKCMRGPERSELRVIRVTLQESEKASALAVVAREGDAWRFVAPQQDFPRVFCRYPMRSSGFLPINIILDAPFDVDQERRRIHLAKPGEQKLFHDAVAAAVELVKLGYEQSWQDRHLLARAAPPPSPLADYDDEECSWLTGEMKFLAAAFATLPLVETRRGFGPSQSVGEWYADFLDLDTDAVEPQRLWPLVNEAESLYPPIEELGNAWSAIARGWHHLGITVNLIDLGSLATQVRDKAQSIDGLQIRGDKREWLVRFLDVLGESWARRGVVRVDVLESLLPDQHGKLHAPSKLKRDLGIPEALKDIAQDIGCDVRGRLLDTALQRIAAEQRLAHVETALAQAVTVELSESDVIGESVAVLERLLPAGRRLTDAGATVFAASIRFLDHLSGFGATAKDVAVRTPLLSATWTIVRANHQQRMMAPVSCWHEAARPFQQVYPPDRILAPEYAEPSVLQALVAWEMAFADPLVRYAPDELKSDRLRVEDGYAPGTTVAGEEFSWIALLHPEIFGRCQNREEAKALLGLVLCYVAPVDPAWRSTRKVTARKAGVDHELRVREALWLGDLLTRTWVPAPGDQDHPTLVRASVESLLPILEPKWLQGNEAALDLLGKFFNFDGLELRLLGAAPDPGKRQQLRDKLARIVELAGADPDAYLKLAEEMQAKQKRAREVQRCRKFGLEVQAAIQQALEAHALNVKVVDRGFDFEVSDEEEASSKLEVGSFLVEVKATRQGEAKMTPRQAETATEEAGRYVLCVVDLRAVPDDRIDQQWSAADVLAHARMVPGIGIHVKDTWKLVDEARSQEVAIRNDAALRYAVPPEVWSTGCSIAEWVERTFKKAVS